MADTVKNLRQRLQESKLRSERSEEIVAPAEPKRRSRKKRAICKEEIQKTGSEPVIHKEEQGRTGSIAMHRALLVASPFVLAN